MAVLGGLSERKAGAVGYREEIEHPALLTPTIATGTMTIDGDLLIKDQRTPHREISEIDQRFVSVRNAPEAEPNLLPLPTEAARFIEALRLLLTGNAQAILDDFSGELVSVDAGWGLRLVPNGSKRTMDLRGCGGRISGLTLFEADGVVRRLIFTSSE